MWYIVLFAALLGADQLIKYWTVEHLALGESAAFLPGIVQLTRVHNSARPGPASPARPRPWRW